MRRLLAVVCLFKGHYNTMVALPEHGFGLYAFSWLGCGRCGRTEAENPVQIAACGEWRLGWCDGCEDCVTTAVMRDFTDRMAARP